MGLAFFVVVMAPFLVTPGVSANENASATGAVLTSSIVVIYMVQGLRERARASSLSGPAEFLFAGIFIMAATLFAIAAVDGSFTTLLRAFGVAVLLAASFSGLTSFWLPWAKPR